MSYRTRIDRLPGLAGIIGHRYRWHTREGRGVSVGGWAMTKRGARKAARAAQLELDRNQAVEDEWYAKYEYDATDTEGE